MFFWLLFAYKSRRDMMDATPRSRRAWQQLGGRWLYSPRLRLPLPAHTPEGPEPPAPPAGASLGLDSLIPDSVVQVLSGPEAFSWSRDSCGILLTRIHNHVVYTVTCRYRLFIR